MNRHNRIWIILAAFVLFGAMVVACSSVDSSGKTPVATDAAALTGEALVQERCTRCHDLTRIQNATKTRAEWEQTVAAMIARGAALNEAETVAVIDYLAETYGK